MAFIKRNFTAVATSDFDFTVNAVLMRLRNAGFEVTKKQQSQHWDVIGPSGWYWRLSYQPCSGWHIEGSQTFNSQMAQFSLLRTLVASASGQ